MKLLTAASPGPMPSSRARPLLVTFGAAALYALGAHIPLPGLEAQVIESMARGGFAITRVSIFALGLVPIFSVLALVEAAKMAVPALLGWENAAPANARRLRFHVLVAALALAAFQAVGVARGLSGIENLVIEPGPIFAAQLAVTFVGATAFLAWLARIIDLHGFGGGFWLLLAAARLAALTGAAGNALTRWRHGVAGPEAFVAPLAVVALSVALIAAVRAAATRQTPRLLAPARTRPREPLVVDPSDFVWPPLLAYLLEPYLFAIPSFALKLAGHPVDLFRLSFDGPAHFVVVAVLIGVFSAMRARPRPAGAPPAWLMAAAQILVCAAPEWLFIIHASPIYVSGPTLIVFVAVAANILARLAKAPTAPRAG